MLSEGKLGSHSLFLPDNDDTDFDPEQIDARYCAGWGADCAGRGSTAMCSSLLVCGACLRIPSVDAMLGAAKKRQRISKEETPTKTTDPATPDKFAMRLSRFGVDVVCLCLRSPDPLVFPPPPLPLCSGKVASKSPASSAAASSKSPSAVFSRLGTFVAGREPFSKWQFRLVCFVAYARSRRPARNPKNAAAGNAAAAGKATAATKNGGSTSIFSRISKESPRFGPAMGLHLGPRSRSFPPSLALTPTPLSSSLRF